MKEKQLGFSQAATDNGERRKRVEAERELGGRMRDLTE